MKVYIHDISNDLKAISKMMSRGKEVPGFGQYLFEATQDGLMITASSHAGGAQRTIGAQVQEPGTICVPPSIADLISGVDGAINLSDGSGADEMMIEAAGFKGSVKGLPVMDYPSPPDVATGGGVTLEASAFFQLMGVAAFADSGSDGVMKEAVSLTWRKKEGKKYVVIAKGADGSVFCSTNVPATQKGRASEVEVLIPQNAIGALRPMLRNISGPVSLAVSKSKSHLVIEADGLRAWISLMPGKYFDVKPLFARVWQCPECQIANRDLGNDPAQCQGCDKSSALADVQHIDTVMGSLDAGQLALAVKKAIVHIAPRGANANASLNAICSVSKGVLRVQYQSGASEPSIFEIPFTTEGPADIDVGFNLQVLDKALSGLGSLVGSSATVMAGFTAPNMPMMLKVSTTAGPIVALVMPVTLEKAQ